MEAEHVGVLAGELVDGLLDREVATVADVAGQEQRGVAGRAHHLHVRAGIARRDDGVGVDEQLGDVVDVAVADADDEHARPEVVLEHPVGEHVGRMTAARRGEVGERPAQPRLELGLRHLDEADAMRMLRGNSPPVQASHCALAAARQLGVAQEPRSLDVVGRVRDLVPLRRAS